MPDGAWRQCVFLLREACGVRARQESAEAVVVMRAGEIQKERRAEGTVAKRPGAWDKAEYADITRPPGDMIAMQEATMEAAVEAAN